MRTYEMDRFHMGRIEPGGDLLEEIEAILVDRGIRSGYLWVLGAVRSGAVGYFDQQEEKYDRIELNEPMEIVVCQGNISMKGGRPFAHLHVNFSDAEGKTYGGHLVPGNEVFVAEVCIAEFSGVPLEREPIPELGLELWPSG